MLSNSRALATTGGGQRVILARSRVLSRCHSGFAGVLKRDSDFLFLCACRFFRGGFGRHVGLIIDNWPPYIWGEATTDTRIGKMSVYFLCGICGSKTLQTYFKMRERSLELVSEQAMVRGLETSRLVRRVFLRIAQRP